MLTFLAGAEVDPSLMRDKLKQSLLLGGPSFLLPFAGALLVARYVVGWDWRAAEIAGAAMSTTSLAVVYAVLVETGLNRTGIGEQVIDRAQFSVLVSVVVLTAVVPAAIAQRFLSPRHVPAVQGLAAAIPRELAARLALEEDDPT